MTKRFAPAAFVCVLAGVRASAAYADEAKPVPYTVQPGDACDTIALKMLGDARLTDVLHRYNPQLGPRPHHLKAGQILMLPPPSPDARLGFVRNQVDVQSKAGAPNDPLYRGNHVTTGEASSAEMTFRDDTQLTMDEKTLVVILGATRTNVAKVSDATLVTGNLRAHLADLAGHSPRAPLSVATPSADVKLGAGDVQLGVDANKATRLAVYRGKSTLTASLTTVKVNEGFGSKAVTGHPPTPPRPLPAAPQWASAPAPLSLATSGPRDVEAEYAPGGTPGAAQVAQWHVQLARDAEFHDLLVDTLVPASVTHLQAKALAAGGYFTRVSGIDNDHFEGPWGAATPLLVATVTTSTETNHYGTVGFTTPGMKCGVNDAPRTPGPLRYDRLTPHVLKCARDDAADKLATLDLPADDVGTLSLEARWVSTDLATREGEAALELRDGSQQPVSRASAQVTPLGKTMIAQTDAAWAAGRYFVETRWLPAATSVGYEINLQGHVARSSMLAIPHEAPPPPKVEATPVEARLGVGVGIVGQGAAQAGGRVQAGIGFRATGATTEFTLGVVGMVERYGSATIDASNVGLPGGSLSASHTDYGGGIAILLRLFPQSAVRPYLSFTPGLLFESGGATGAGASTDLSGGYATLTPALGLDIAAGPGAIFLEPAYRGAWKISDNQSPSVSPAGFLGTAGYLIDF